MCTCLIYIGMFIMGIFALVKGEVALTRKITARGWWARSIGILFVLCGPVALGTVILITLVVGMSQGGGDPEAAQRWAQDNAGVIALIEYGVVASVVVISLIIAIIGANRSPLLAEATSDQPVPPRPESDNPYDPPVH